MPVNQSFTMTPTTITFDTSLPPLARLLWQALEHFSGNNATCWPGYAALAGKVGCSVRWIPHLLQRLVEAGLLVIQPRQGRTSVYRLLGRVGRHRAEITTHAQPSQPPRKPNSYNQKQALKTNKKGGYNPPLPAAKSSFDMSKYQPGGKYAALVTPRPS